MPDKYTEYRTDNDGNVVDPPRIPEFESRMRDAQSSGDESQIAVVQEDYDAARQRIVDKHNESVNARRKDDERLLAQERQRAEQDREQTARANTERAERERLEVLRENERTEGANGENVPDAPVIGKTITKKDKGDDK